MGRHGSQFPEEPLEASSIAMAKSEAYLSDLLEHSIWMSPYMYARRSQRTVEEVDRELEELKKSSDITIDYEQLGHEAYAIQNLLLCLKRDMGLTDWQIKRLRGPDLRESDEKLVTLKLLEARMESYESDHADLTARYQVVVEEIKARRFNLVRKDLDKEREEILATIAAQDEAMADIAKETKSE